MIDKIINKLSRKQLLICFWLFWVASYGVMGGINTFRETFQLSMVIDQYIPVWTPAVLWYLMYYPFIFLTFVFISEGENMRNGLKAFVYIALITNLFFIFFPTLMFKPSFEIVNYFDEMVHVIYSIDTPANAFPSQHVAYTVLCSILYSRHFKGAWPVFLVLAIAISISTVLTKQHYVWDVFAGALIAVGCYYLAFRKKQV